MKLPIAFILFCLPACSGAGPQGVDTMAKVIERRTDDFPETHRVAIPLSARNSVGSTVDPVGPRRISPRYNNCFFVVEQEQKGLQRIAETLGASEQVKAEFSAVAAALGGRLESEDKVIIEFTNLTVFGGYGIPNLTAPCGKLENGSSVEVITEQIRAGKAKVSFSRSFKSRVGVEAGARRAKAELSVGWSGNQDGDVVGENIVLTGRVDEVKIAVEHADNQVIADDVKPGTSFELPKGLRDLGFLAVQRVDVPGDTVSIRFQPRLSANLEVDPAKAAALPPNRCKIGEDHALGANDLCLFWLAPGNAALVVGWTRKDDKKQLWATYYRTTMEPTRTKVAAEDVTKLIVGQD